MLREFPIPVQGGTLQLCITLVDVADDLEPDSPATTTVHRLSFEYSGRLPKEMALDLVRQTPDDGFRVNDMPVLEFLEGLC